MNALKCLIIGVSVYAMNNMNNKKKRNFHSSLKCTRNRGRTGTGISAHRILSPACLPIPPSEPLSLLKDGANVQFLFYSAKFSASISLLSEFTVDKISRRNDTGVTFFSITSI